MTVLVPQVGSDCGAGSWYLPQSGWSRSMLPKQQCQGGQTTQSQLHKGGCRSKTGIGAYNPAATVTGPHVCDASVKGPAYPAGTSCMGFLLEH